MAIVFHVGGEISHYDILNVRGFLPLHEGMYVAGMDGINQLYGADDNGVPIRAVFRTGGSNLGSPLRKNPKSMFLFGETLCDVTVIARVDDGESFVCDTNTPQMDSVLRAKSGDAHFSTIQLEVVSSGQFTVSMAECELSEKTRRTGRHR